MVYRRLDAFPRSDRLVTVYLLHFSEPFGHAQHYIGVTGSLQEVPRRLGEHRSGKGAVLCKHATDAGISLTVARVWVEVPRYTEIKLKNQGGARRLCPICQGRSVPVNPSCESGSPAPAAG